MADSLLKLKVESSEYDAKLKKAAEGIRHLADVAHQSDGDMTGLEKSTLDYIKALGDMETKSRSASGQVRELESTYKELKVIYDQLNEVEKADEGGKALAASLDKLKQRAQDARKSLDDATKSLQDNGDASQKDSSILSQLASKFTINVDAIKLFNIGLKAASVALDVAKDAFFATEGNIDEWGRTVQSSEAAYSVFLQTLNTGNWSDFFTNLETAVRGARDLYDALDRLGSIKNNNAAAIAIVEQQIAQLRLAKQQGQNVDDQLKNAISTLRQLQNQAIGAGKNAGLKMAAETIKTRFNAQGGNLANSSATAITEQIMKRGQAVFDEQKKIFENLKQKGMVTQYNVTTTKTGATYLAPSSQKFDINALTKEEQKQYKLAKAITEGETEIQKGIAAYSQAVQEGTAAAREEFKGNRYVLQGSGKSGGNKKEQTEIQKNQEKINKLSQEYALLGDKATEAARKRQEEIQKEIKLLQERNGLLGLREEQAQGRLLLKGSDIDLSASGVNKTMLGDLGITSKPKGLDKPAQLNDKALKALQKTMDKQLQQLIKEQNYEKKQETTVAGGIGDLAGGLGSIVGGLEQLGIEIPDGFKSAINAMQGISTILTGIATTVLAIEAIAGADAIIPFAHGGTVPHAANGFFVPGTHLSGDVTPILANAGEVILNKSQQNNLAPQLTGGGLQNLRLEAVVSAEQILLASNNRGLRTGRGEIVQSRRRR